jgi:membrane protease YdiL (CAAX protease family)
MSSGQATEAQPPNNEADGEVPVSVLFAGPPRYRAVTPWGPVEALALTAIAALLAPMLTTLPVLFYGIMQSPAGTAGMQNLSLASPLVLALMVVSQLTSIALIWLLAGRANMRPDTLQFRQAALSWLGCLAAGLLIVLATSLLELGMNALGRFDPVGETRMLWEGLRSPYWLGTVIVAVVLAPIWEELAFRGFLLTALAKTRLGIVGGGLITNTLWTLMHLQYSPAGMASVFLAGLMLTWIMWRTSSIRACIVAHAVINAVSTMYLYYAAPAA